MDVPVFKEPAVSHILSQMGTLHASLPYFGRILIWECDAESNIMTGVDAVTCMSDYKQCLGWRLDLLTTLPHDS
jgi:hypothetical protein